MTDAGVDERSSRKTVERPAAERGVSVLEAAAEAGRVVSIVGRCVVDAEEGPEVAMGDRLVLVKPDGTVVVHGPASTSPLIEVAADGVEAAEADGRLRLDVSGRPGVDRIEFERVDLLSQFALDDVGRGPTTRSDRHARLRQRLLADPDLVEPGFRPLSTERETAAGPIDLYGRDADGRAVVVEIKAHRAGPAAVGQLDRYVSALRRDLHADAEVRGVLVAPSATERTRSLLAERDFLFRPRSPDA